MRPVLDRPGIAFSWGASGNGRNLAPRYATNIVGISAGRVNSLATTSEGKVIVWGYVSNGANDFSNLTGPATNVEGSWSIGGMGYAIRSDGSVQSASGIVLSNFTNIVSVSSSSHTLGLKADGSLVATGSDSYGETQIPAGLTNVVGIATALNSSFALLQDGSVVGWGRFAQFTANNLLAINGWTNIVQISGIPSFGLLGLTEDGRILSTSASFGVPAAGQGEFVQVSGCKGTHGSHAIALKRDGTVVVWGNNSAGDFGQLLVPEGLGGVFQVAAGELHNVVLVDPSIDVDGDGMPISWEIQYFGSPAVEPLGDLDHDSFSNLQEYLSGRDPRRWHYLTVDAPGFGSTPNAFYTIETFPGATYEVWFSENLEYWWREDLFTGDGTAITLGYYDIRSRNLFLRIKSSK